MKQKKLILVLLFVFLGTATLSADQLSQAQGLFYQGNTHYSEEKFDQAIADYEGALTLGLESGPLYYNLANAYFKHGSLGKAILNYSRARQLIPRDADLRSNLDYAQSLIEGGEVAGQNNWLLRRFCNAAESFSLNELCLISTVLYFVLGGLIILVILVRKLRRALAYIVYPMLAALIIFGAMLFSQFYQSAILRQAVIIAEVADSKFEPFADATTYFSLYEGELVFVSGAQEDWLKVKRQDGRQGWLKLSDLELL